MRIWRNVQQQASLLPRRPYTARPSLSTAHRNDPMPTRRSSRLFNRNRLSTSRAPAISPARQQYRSFNSERPHKLRVWHFSLKGMRRPGTSTSLLQGKARTLRQLTGARSHQTSRSKTAQLMLPGQKSPHRLRCARAQIQHNSLPDLMLARPSMSNQLHRSLGTLYPKWSNTRPRDGFDKGRLRICSCIRHQTLLRLVMPN